MLVKYRWVVAVLVLVAAAGCQAAGNEDEDFSQGDEPGDVICNIIKFGSTIQCKRLGPNKCKDDEGNSTDSEGEENGNNTNSDCKCSQAPIAISVSKVEEVDDQDVAIESHSITLSKDHFKPKQGGSKNDQNLPNGKGGKSGPKGKKREIDVSLDLPDDHTASMTMSLFLLDEDGELDLDGEATQLKKGQLKINTKLQDWYWCGDNATYEDTDCDGKTGEAIMLYFVVENRKAGGKKPTAGNQEDGKPQKFSLDCGGFVSFSTKVYIDDEQWVDMLDGFPTVDDEVESKGKGKAKAKPGTKRFGVRIPRFAQSADYDPQLETGNAEEDGGNGASAVASAVSLLISLLLAGILL